MVREAAISQFIFIYCTYGRIFFLSRPEGSAGIQARLHTRALDFFFFFLLSLFFFFFYLRFTCRLFIEIPRSEESNRGIEKRFQDALEQFQARSHSEMSLEEKRGASSERGRRL